MLNDKVSAKANCGLWQDAQLRELSFERIGSKNNSSPNCTLDLGSFKFMLNGVTELTKATETINKQQINRRNTDFILCHFSKHKIITFVHKFLQNEKNHNCMYSYYNAFVYLL
jgi:hypothetical protein